MTSPPSVVALVSDGVEAPGDIEIVRTECVLGAAAYAEVATFGADWLWLLDGSVRPRADTLAELLDAAGGHGDLPEPSLLASLAVTEGGAPAEDHAPWFRRGETDLALRAVTRRLLPVRAAQGGSLLVRTAAARAVGPPPAHVARPVAALEWTSRVLRGRVGYLVTASLVDAATPGIDAPARAQALAAMLAGHGVDPRERLWLAAEGADALRRRPSLAPALARAALSARRASRP
jgi:hypothetical protein